MVDQLHPKYRFARSRNEAEPLFQFIQAGLAACGSNIHWHSRIDENPMQLTVAMPGDQRFGLLLYAFPIVRRTKDRRPESPFAYTFTLSGCGERPLAIHRDPTGLLTTLLVGIDVERNFLVGADCHLNTPTPVVDSIGFRDSEARTILRAGWHQWEREQTTGSDDPVDVLVGAAGHRILDYLLFEQTADGLDAGPRHLVAEKCGAMRVNAKRRAAAQTARQRPTIAH